jgi:hypothetical protein
MKDVIKDSLTKEHPLEHVDLDREPELPFRTNWLQERENHVAVLNTFWNYVRATESVPKEKASLVLFYAKQVPFVEDISRRVLIGVGHVAKLGQLTEYEYSQSDGKIRSLLWERMVTHSIRLDQAEGFLFPYHKLIQAAQSNPDLDLEQFAVFAPADRFEEFSFATEHVSDDSAIAALGAMRDGLHKAADVLPGLETRRLDAWIDSQLGRLWKRRGPFPGLGSVLCAFGVHLGHFIAQSVYTKVGEHNDPWPALDQMFGDPRAFLLGNWPAI